MSEVFMTSKEVCDFCGFSRVVLDRLERQGLLKPARKFPLSGKRLYLPADVDKYMEAVWRKRAQ